MSEYLMLKKSSSKCLTVKYNSFISNLKGEI